MHHENYVKFFAWWCYNAKANETRVHKQDNLASSRTLISLWAFWAGFPPFLEEFPDEVILEQFYLKILLVKQITFTNYSNRFKNNFIVSNQFWIFKNIAKWTLYVLSSEKKMQVVIEGPCSIKFWSCFHTIGLIQLWFVYLCCILAISPNAHI